MNTDHSEDIPLTVWEHIHDLRKRLTFLFIFFIVSFLITHHFHKEIIAFLLQYAEGQTLIFLSPIDSFLFIFKVDAIGAFLLSLPVIVWNILAYISPLLSQKIKKSLFYFCLFSFLLVTLALLYSLFITIPLVLNFLFSISINGIENQFSAQEYIKFIINQIMIIVTIFQLPLVIIGIVKMGIVTRAYLSKKRPFIYLILTVGSAIITPTSDLFSLAIVLVPCFIIFEISLLITKYLK
jgi:sec-independent protein translocase protein TatC